MTGILWTTLVPVDFRNGRFRDLAVNKRSDKTRIVHRSYARGRLRGTTGEQLFVRSAWGDAVGPRDKHPLRPPHSHGSCPHARPALRAAATPCCPAAAATLSYGQHQPSRSGGSEQSRKALLGNAAPAGKRSTQVNVVIHDGDCHFCISPLGGVGTNQHRFIPPN